MARNPAEHRDNVSLDDLMRVEDGVVRPPGSGFPPGQGVGEDLRSDPNAPDETAGEAGEAHEADEAARPGDA